MLVIENPEASENRDRVNESNAVLHEIGSRFLRIPLDGHPVYDIPAGAHMIRVPLAVDESDLQRFEAGSGGLGGHPVAALGFHGLQVFGELDR